MEGEREGEKHQPVASSTPPTGDSPQPRHVSPPGINQQPLTLQCDAQPTESHRPGF